MSERRNKIVQWMLNQGSGIVDAPETCFLKETTEKEQAEHPFGSVRYVYSMVVNLFENEIPFPEQVDYAATCSIRTSKHGIVRTADRG